MMSTMNVPLILDKLNTYIISSLLNLIKSIKIYVPLDESKLLFLKKLTDRGILRTYIARVEILTHMQLYRSSQKFPPHVGHYLLMWHIISLFFVSIHRSLYIQFILFKKNS